MQVSVQNIPKSARVTPGGGDGRHGMATKPRARTLRGGVSGERGQRRSAAEADRARPAGLRHRGGRSPSSSAGRGRCYAGRVLWAVRDAADCTGLCWPDALTFTPSLALKPGDKADLREIALSQTGKRVWTTGDPRQTPTSAG
jgi:hypothetical protein